MGLRTLSEDGKVRHIVVDPPPVDVKRMKVTFKQSAPARNGQTNVTFEALLDKAQAEALEEGIEYYMEFFPVPEQAAPAKPKTKPKK